MFGDYLTSTVDYPDKVCTTIFTRGCNLHCGYCYNSSLFIQNNPKDIPVIKMLDILDKRKLLTNYVCVTGGEPTIHNDLHSFLRYLHINGFKIKLDTNGSRPHELMKCLNYVDYIALDIKTCANLYYTLSYPTEFPIQNLRDSIKLVKESGVDYELRTVMMPFYVNERNIHDIINLVGWMGNPMLYRLLQFNNENCYLSRWCGKVKPYTLDRILNFKKIIESYGINNVKVSI